MNCSIPGFPVHCQLLEFTQTNIHWVGVAIQTAHPLSPPYPPAFNFSQHQGLFQCVSSSHQVAIGVSASVLPMSILDWFPLGWTGWISLQSKGPSSVFSNTTVRKYQLFSAQLFSVQLSHRCMTTGKTIALTRWIFVGKVMSLFFNMLSRS